MIQNRGCFHGDRRGYNKDSRFFGLELFIYILNGDDF